MKGKTIRFVGSKFNKFRARISKYCQAQSIAESINECVNSGDGDDS